MSRGIFSKNNFRFLLASLMLFCFFTPKNSFAENRSHDHFYCDKSCGTSLFDNHIKSNGDTWNNLEGKSCGSWQMCDFEDQTFVQCSCDKDCLAAPRNQRYLDDPINHTLQKSDTSINLPVMLVWDNIPGWLSDDYSSTIGGPLNKGQGRWFNNGNDCVAEINFDKKGPKSYRLQIQDTSAGGTDNLNLSPTQKNNLNQDEGTEAIGSKLSYYKVLTKNAFNSRDDGGECFFNTNSAYKWRVEPCCDKEGASCKSYGPDEGWWYFSTSPSPEPLGINDKNNTGSPKQDPDWNGDQYLANIDFCSAKLSWCKAKLVNNSTSRYWKTYNDHQLDYAASYQMRVKFSENWSLGLASSNGALSWLTDKLLNNPIAQSFSYIYKQAANMTSEEKNDGESCHYLEKQSNGSCKPETVSFGAGEIQQSDFKPFFDANQRRNQNRSLFTGDMKGSLVYSWQTKVCFNTTPSNNTDKDFPTCNGYNDADYGQKWKFAGANTSTTKINPPDLQSPENNSARDDTKLVGLSDKITWSTPCGANSFLYDIKEKDSGQSIFKNDSSYGKDSGRRTTASQTLLSLTDKIPTQADDPQNVVLKLNTFYQWRVKSCWPSLPVGDISSICGGNKDWHYFYTTGRPPKDDSLKYSDSAPNINFSWESVPGAGSYIISITENGVASEHKTTTNQWQISYPGALTSYTWQVRTCADADGKICGSWSKSNSFNSGDFPAPTDLTPTGEIKQLPSALSWSSNAKNFLVTATYSGVSDSSCDPMWFNAQYADKKISGTSMAVQTKASGGSPHCAGIYTFTVQPCFDANCTSLSHNIGKAKFIISDPEQKSGFMVCGQKTNDPTTPYNEKEPCQIKHLFLTLKVIIDFIVFKLAFIFLPLLVLATGAIFYFSEDKTKTIPTLKKAWKNIGLGYGALFFAWFIVSLLMFIAGYHTIWWQVL